MPVTVWSRYKFIKNPCFGFFEESQMKIKINYEMLDIGYKLNSIHLISDIFSFTDVRYPIFSHFLYLSDMISDI